MKTRHGFVSNSSSSSFVILKTALTEVQLLMIRNHIKTAKFLNGLDKPLEPLAFLDIEWEIAENDKQIIGKTSMDNFDMGWLLNQIGVPTHDIFWGE